MRGAVARFEQSLPLSAILPFLLTAPWFAAVAGVSLAVLGAPPLTSRRSSGALALTHLITAGFMLQAMCGALLRFAPVGVGARLRCPRLMTGLAQPLLAVGAISLTLGLGLPRPVLVGPAATLWATGLLVLLRAIAGALWRADGPRSTIVQPFVAVLGLAVTVTLGLLLAEALSGHMAVPLVAITNLHALWGLGGWALVLLVVVSSTVVPMLQLTPRYPPWLPPAATAAVLAAVAVATGSWNALTGGAWLTTVLGFGLLPAALFAATTLLLQARRRRARRDVGLSYHRLSMVAVLLLAVWWTSAALGAPWARTEQASIAAAILGLVGVFVSAISGMLYKIVPFTLWLSLCRTCGVQHTPGMTQLLPDAWARGQLRLHGIALVALSLAPVLPFVARPAGMLFATSGTWLGVNVTHCAWIGWRVARRTPSPPARPPARPDRSRPVNARGSPDPPRQR